MKNFLSLRGRMDKTFSGKRRGFNAFLAFVLLLVVSCKSENSEPEIITVTIEPQRYFVERIAGDKVLVQSLVPPGSSPETYDPTPVQMTVLGKSRAYFKSGYLGFELAWLGDLMQNNRHVRLYDNSENIDMIMEVDECDNVEHHHSHGVDPHYWTSPKQALLLSKNIYQALVELYPRDSLFFKENYTQLVRELQSVDSLVASRLSGISARTFLIYHPSLSYLARDYGLKQLSIENFGKEPSAQYMKQIIEQAGADSAKVIFIQKEFDQSNALTLSKELGLKVVPIDPLSYQWREELFRVVDGLKP